MILDSPTLRQIKHYRKSNKNNLSLQNKAMLQVTIQSMEIFLNIVSANTRATTRATLPGQPPLATPWVPPEIPPDYQSSISQT